MRESIKISVGIVFLFAIIIFFIFAFFYEYQPSGGGNLTKYATWVLPTMPIENKSRKNMLQAHKKVQESLNNLNESLYRTDRLLHELCTDPHNYKTCNKYGVFKKPVITDFDDGDDYPDFSDGME